MPEIVRFDARAACFPPPRVPVLPPPSLQELQWASLSKVPAFPALPRHYWHYKRGRYALRDAYLLAGLDARHGLLAPAYHCRTMLDPALALGVRILLYPQNPDLSPNLAAVQQLIAHARSGGQSMRALLLTHYFGVPQPIASVQDLCHRSGLELIEDCSHALVLDPRDNISPALDSGIACTARLGVASPYKFLAAPDGGLLWADPAMGSPSHVPQASDLASNAVAALRLACGLLTPTPRSPTPVILPSLKVPTLPDLRRWEDGPSSDFEADNQHLQSLSISRQIARHARLPRIVALRRQRFGQWAEVVSRLPNCRALVPRLGSHTVPYMFPLLLDTPEPAFHMLKQSGVPIWRWDQMAVSACKVAMDYRLRLLHLPCHQGLTDQQMAWMTETLRRVLLNCASEGDRLGSWADPQGSMRP